MSAVGLVLRRWVVDSPVNGRSAPSPWHRLPVESKLRDIACMCMTQVVCAGVWHNGLLCLACWLSALLLPMLLLPLYSTGQGAVVWWVTQQLHGKLVLSWLHKILSDEVCVFLASMLLWHAWSQSSALVLYARSVPQHSALHSHLQPGDTITDVNGCTVRSTDTLRACIFAQVHRHFEPSHQCESVLARDPHVQLTLTCHASKRLTGLPAGCGAAAAPDASKTASASCQAAHWRPPDAVWGWPGLGSSCCTRSR